MIRHSLKSGFALVAGNKRILLLFYLSNLLFAFAIMLPIRSAADSFLGKSLSANQLAAGLDPTVLVELIKHGLPALSAASATLLVLPIAYWAAGLLLAAGALATFASGRAFRATVFWSDAVRYFGRFVRLALWSLPLLGVLMCLQFAEPAVRQLLFGPDPLEYVAYWGGWVRVGLRALGLVVFAVVIEFARVHIVAEDEHRTRVALWRGIRFAARHVLPVAGLTLFFSLAATAGLVLYNAVTAFLANPTVLVAVGLFICQQIFIAFRLALRVWRYAAQMRLYKSAVAPAVAFPVQKAEVQLEEVPA